MQGIVELLRAGGGAAGAVNMEDNRLGVRFGQPPQRFDPVAVVADQAGDLDAGDIAAAGEQAPARHQQQGQAADGEQNDHRGGDAPEGQFTPQPAAIDDGIGIERHGKRSSITRQGG